MTRASSYFSRLAPSPQINFAIRSISARVSASWPREIASPWHNAFWLARFLPAADLGPVLLAALRRLAARFVSDVMTVPRKLFRLGVPHRDLGCASPCWATGARRVAPGYLFPNPRSYPSPPIRLRFILSGRNLMLLRRLHQRARRLYAIPFIISFHRGRGLGHRRACDYRSNRARHSRRGY